MDTATRKIAATILVLATFSLALGSEPATGSAARPAPEPPAVRLSGADADQEATVDWAVRRFAQAGLPELPPLEIFIHPTREGCRGNLGYSVNGRIDLCTTDSSEPYARKIAVHEMAHAWVEVHVDEELRHRFLQLRGLTGWNDRADTWKERGTEQAAEIIAWGLGEGEVSPLLPEPPSTADMIAAYVLLTGSQPITVAATA